MRNRLISPSVRLSSAACVGAFLAVAAPGCGSGVASTGLVSDDRQLEPALEDVYTYGTAFGEVYEMLGDEVSLGFDASGNLFILDSGNYRVLVVGTDGGYAREFGRQGDGPGEMSSPQSFVVNPDGSVAIYDNRQRSFTRFDAAGQYIGDARVAMGFSQAEQQLRVAGQDRVVVLGEGSTIPGRGGARGAPGSTTQQLGTQGRGGNAQGRGGAGQGRGGNAQGGGGGAQGGAAGTQAEGAAEATGGRQAGGATGGGNAGRGGRGGQPDTIPTTMPLRWIDLESATTEVFYQSWRPQLAEIPAAALAQAQGGRGGGRGGGGLNRFTDANNVGFLPIILFDGFPDGRVAVSDSSDYEVEILLPNGQVEQVVTRDIAPRPVTEDIIELDRERRLAAIESGENSNIQGAAQRATFGGGGFGGGGRGGGPGGGGGDPQQQIQQAIERELERLKDFPYAPEVPVIRRVKADPAGRLWIERVPEDLMGPGPIDVISLESGYIGTFAAGEVTIPDAFGPDGLVAYVERDEYDVPMVAVRRLGPPFR